MYSGDRLVILDADGTTIDAFTAIRSAFAVHGMNLGDLERFQRRRNPFKYLGGFRDFSGNLRNHISRTRRNKIIDTLTEVYRFEGTLYPGIANLMNRLITLADCRVGVLTRNITWEPEETLKQLYARQGVEVAALDFLTHIPLKQQKAPYFRSIRDQYLVNPARSYSCGDEQIDFLAAQSTGTHPFMAAYGFEGYWRLIYKSKVPKELISQDSQELCARMLNALGLNGEGG
ncbi:haloacid dehalogenase [Achromatium sp. WMS2]|nr:haloacid dehalogenase [Achromatium sp. WMS2]